MKNLEIDSGTNLNHILSEIKNTQEDGLELTGVPGQDSILDKKINRTIIEKFAKEHKKEIVFPAIPIEAAPEVESDDLGFVEGEDIVQKAPIEEAHKMIASTGPVQPQKKSNKFFKKLMANKLVWIGAAAIVLLLLISGVFYLLPTATIELTPKAESKEAQVILTGDPDTKGASTETNTIYFQTAEVTKEGSGQQATSGKKTIGTPAKGRVTVTNQSLAEKDFVAGTIITPKVVPGSTTAPDVTFKLDTEVKLPPSQGFGNDSTAGVNVTATKAGADGNLPANSSFQVGTADTVSVFAKNDVAFSGGDSKQATVASQADRDALKKTIIDKLEEEAKADIEKKQKGIVVVTDSYETKVNKETYDPKAVDAEADTLKATINITVKAAFVDSDDLNKLVTASLEKSASGYNVKEEDLKIVLSQTSKESDGTIKMLAKVEAQLTPSISQDELKKNLAGKSISDAKKYLDSIAEVSEYKVVVQPIYFRIFGHLPFKGDRILIVYK